jgi:hypothetical protein
MSRLTVAELQARFDAVEAKVDAELIAIKSKSYSTVIVAAIIFANTWIVWTVRGWICG